MFYLGSCFTKKPKIMLVVNIAWLIRLRGSKHPYAYMINHGYSKQQARSLPTIGPKRLTTELQQRLCETFKCGLEDLHDWMGDPNHWLAKLKKPSLPTLEKMLDDKGPEEIMEFIRGLGK
jgi:hypothetical protein